MNGLVILLLALICLLFATENFGQEIYKVKGTVQDAETHMRIPDVHIESSKSAVVTNEQGYFAITVQKGDSIYVSHVGYHSHTVITTEAKNDTLLVMLARSTNVLNPVTVTDIPTEEELKAKILETPVVITREEENAQANLQNIRTLYKLGYRPEMNAMDNFRESIKGPQGVTFLSSKGGGIFKALKTLTNPPSVSFPRRKQYMRPMTSLTFFKPQVLALDTVRSDTLATKRP